MAWQQLFTVVIVALAVVFLGRRLYRSFAGRRGGSGCSGCADAKPSAPVVRKQLIAPHELLGDRDTDGSDGAVQPRR